MYDSDLTTATSPMISSAPYSGLRPGKDTKPTKPSSCCEFGSNRKTQPYYWLARDQQKRKSRILKERTAWNKQRTSGLTRKSTLL